MRVSGFVTTAFRAAARRRGLCPLLLLILPLHACGGDDGDRVAGSPTATTAAAISTATVPAAPTGSATGAPLTATAPRPTPPSPSATAVPATATATATAARPTPSRAPGPWQRTEERAPCARYAPLRSAFFGDLHVHTRFSADAHIFGTRLDPCGAYAFARGAEVALADDDEQQTRRVTIERRLDFTAVTDHAEFFGEVLLCSTPGTPSATITFPPSRRASSTRPRWASRRACGRRSNPTASARGPAATRWSSRTTPT